MTDTPSTAVRPVLATPADPPEQRWHDQRGRIAWSTLFSAGATPTDTLTAGVAVMEPGGYLALHRHPPAELYYILEGVGEVTIEGETQAVVAGTGVFIPGNAEHAIRNASSARLRFLYAFAVDRFEDVAYTFSSPAA